METFFSVENTLILSASFFVVALMVFVSALREPGTDTPIGWLVVAGGGVWLILMAFLKMLLTIPEQALVILVVLFGFVILYVFARIGKWAKNRGAR